MSYACLFRKFSFKDCAFHSGLAALAPIKAIQTSKKKKKKERKKEKLGLLTTVHLVNSHSQIQPTATGISTEPADIEGQLYEGSFNRRLYDPCIWVSAVVLELISHGH